MLASSQTKAPAGAAIVTARPRTKRVRSRMERISKVPIFGQRYPGNSRVKVEGIPRRIVLESNSEQRRVAPTPTRITRRTKAEASRLFVRPSKATEKKEAMINRVGKRPLQGTKLLVKMAISLSRAESIIRQAVTPTALQPKPIHMVRDCFPWAPAFLKNLSRLKATLGKKPRSSKKVKSGKKMAIGGNMTETTQARER